jgi:hypothetical protein
MEVHAMNTSAPTIWHPT